MPGGRGLTCIVSHGAEIVITTTYRCRKEERACLWNETGGTRDDTGEGSSRGL